MNFEELSGLQLTLLILLAVWELIWKGIALWRAARNNQTGWFVALLIINSAGLLPIIYLLTHKSSKPS
jgi:hypothetical protein